MGIEKIIRQFKKAKPEEIKIENKESNTKYSIFYKGFDFELGKYAAGYDINIFINILKDGECIKIFSSFSKYREIYDYTEKKILNFQKEKQEQAEKQKIRDLRRLDKLLK